MKSVQFNDMEITIINQIMQMIIHFFPNTTEIHKHARIIHKKIEDS